MKAKEEFKNKAELAAELDKLGVEYKKVESGKSAGKPTQTTNELYELYKSAVEGGSTGKPVFHRPVRKFNSMTFRF
jgi:hypothetical protein